MFAIEHRGSGRALAKRPQAESREVWANADRDHAPGARRAELKEFTRDN